jgi:hypothetical protein
MRLDDERFAISDSEKNTLFCSLGFMAPYNAEDPKKVSRKESEGFH